MPSLLYLGEVAVVVRVDPFLEWDFLLMNRQSKEAASILWLQLLR